MDRKKEVKKQMIPIVMAMDDLFVIPSYVAIWSLLKNSSYHYFYDIFILYANGLSEKSRYFISQAESVANCKIHFLQVRTQAFENVSLKQGITVPTMFRLLIGDYLQEYDRCIYIDGDILVLGDISELYSISVGDNYIGAVRDGGIQMDIEKHEAYAEVIGMEHMEDYFNAGVLLMNLSLIRKDNMKEFFLSSINQKYLYQDQDILNKCCQGRIVYLPLKYNVFRRFYRRGELLEDSIFPIQERKEAVERPLILHYAESEKPWNNLRGVASDVWWEYAQNALPSDRYEECRKRAENITGKGGYEGMAAIISQYDEVVVFGYSFYGKEAVRILRNLGLRSVVAFCDNNEKKQGEVFEGLEVKSLAQIKKEYKNPFFVNASQRQAGIVAGFLQENGYGREQVWHYNYPQYRKTELYFSVLDKRYYFSELQWMVLAECGLLAKTWEELCDFIKKEENKFLIDKYYMDVWVLYEENRKKQTV